jgi:hypothetical protein
MDACEGTRGPAHVEYEFLVRKLVLLLSGACRHLGAGQVRGTRGNLISGKSGFPHQIDVSVQFDTHLVLMECKHWQDPVGAEAILTLAARQQDIREEHPTKNVYSSMVSTRLVTEGANVLAKHFGITIDVVASFEEYAITIVNRHFAGVLSTFSAADACEADVNLPQ